MTAGFWLGVVGLLMWILMTTRDERRRARLIDEQIERLKQESGASR